MEIKLTVGWITSIVTSTCRDILKLTKLIIDRHSFCVLDHVVIPCAMVGGVFRLRVEKSFYVMQGCIKGSSGGPSACGTTGKIETTEKLLILLSNLQVMSLVRHD